jgi:predicted ferric reductase
MITRTIDNGCLPSRPQTSLLVAYFVFLQIATFYGIDYSMKRTLVAAAIQRRSGLFAISHLVPMFILAARNNPLIWLTGISFDTFNLFHRWVGRFIGFEILIHATTYFIKKIETQGWAGYRKSLRTSWFTRAGTIVRRLFPFRIVADRISPPSLCW